MLNNNILWTDKYKPLNLDNFYGNKENIKLMSEWIEDFKNKKKDTKISLFISGPPGIGKTTIAHILLLKYNYEIIEYNASDVRSQKAVKENLNRVMNSSNISIMKNNERKNIAIIMDEVDGMSSGDRGGVAELVSIINPNKGKKKTDKIQLLYNNPIICISNNNIDKKLSELRQNSFEIIFLKPSYDDLQYFCNKIIEEEKIKISEESIEKIIHYSQSDFRRVAYLLQDLSIIIPDLNITDETISQQLESFSEKKIDINLFKATEKLFEKYYSIQDTISFYECDRSLVSMMVHENIIYNLTKPEIKQHLNIIYDIYHYFSIGDIIDKIIYNNQTWYLQDLNGILKCSLPSLIFNTIFNNNKKLKPILFTSILSKSAIQFSNFKNIIHIKNKFNMNKKYLFYINTIILETIFKEKNQNLKTLELLKYYNIDIITIDKIVKLSKINKNIIDYQKLFTNKNKNKIIKLLNLNKK
jgi:replication factor C subunit 1